MAAMTTLSTVSTTTSSTSFAEMERVISVTVPLIFSVVASVGFVGNLLVVFVVSFNRQMRNTTYLLILNLAVADLLFIVFCVPFTAFGYAFPHDWPFGDLWCGVTHFLIITTASVSIYTLVLMSLDRFLAVVLPIQSMTLRTESHCRHAIAITWILVVVSGTPCFFAHGEIVDAERTYCSFLDGQVIPIPVPQGWARPKWSLLAFQVTFFFAAYALPFLLICVLYSLMLCRLLRKPAVSGRVSAESLRQKRRVLILVLTVIIVFGLCWLPIHMILVLRALRLYSITPWSISAQIVAHVLAYSNSCVNPILYAFLSEPFRVGFAAVIKCVRPSGPHGLGNNNNNNNFEMAENANNSGEAAEANNEGRGATRQRNEVKQLSGNRHSTAIQGDDKGDQKGSD